MYYKCHSVSLFPFLGPWSFSCSLLLMTAARERWRSDWSVGLESPSVLGAAATNVVNPSPKHAAKCQLKGTTAQPLSPAQPSESLSSIVRHRQGFLVTRPFFKAEHRCD